MPLSGSSFHNDKTERGLTLALNSRNYMKLAHPGVSISKLIGYLKQRMKLNPDAFWNCINIITGNLCRFHLFNLQNHLILPLTAQILIFH